MENLENIKLASDLNLLKELTRLTINDKLTWNLKSDFNPNNTIIFNTFIHPNYEQAITIIKYQPIKYVLIIKNLYPDIYQDMIHPYKIEVELTPNTNHLKETFKQFEIIFEYIQIPFIELEKQKKLKEQEEKQIKLQTHIKETETFINLLKGT